MALSKVADDEDLVTASVNDGLRAILTNGTHGMLGTLRVGGLNLHGELL